MSGSKTAKDNLKKWLKGIGFNRGYVYRALVNSPWDSIYDLSRIDTYTLDLNGLVKYIESIESKHNTNNNYINEIKLRALLELPQQIRNLQIRKSNSKLAKLIQELDECVACEIKIIDTQFDKAVNILRNRKCELLNNLKNRTINTKKSLLNGTDLDMTQICAETVNLLNNCSWTQLSELRVQEEKENTKPDPQPDPPIAPRADIVLDMDVNTITVNPDIDMTSTDTKKRDKIMETTQNTQFKSNSTGNDTDDQNLALLEDCKDNITSNQDNCQTNQQNDIDLKFDDIKGNLYETSSGATSGILGLRNLGNTCFFNSVLQCLSNTVPLRNYFLQIETSSAFSDFIRSLWVLDNNNNNNNNNGNSMAPELMKNVIKKIDPNLMNGDQQDSFQFLSLVLTQMHEELNANRSEEVVYYDDIDENGQQLSPQVACNQFWSKYQQLNQSIISKLFHSLFRKVLQCEKCGSKWTEFDVYGYLSLPVMKKSGRAVRDINQCINLYVSPEKLNSYCENCDCDGPMTKTLDLWTFPNILIVHFKRFKTSKYGNKTMDKLTHLIKFPINGLNMKNFVVNKEINKNDQIYDLFAVTSHGGTCDGGHYWAYCFNSKDKKWRRYNDSFVSHPIEPEDVVTPGALMLFYQKRRVER